MKRVLTLCIIHQHPRVLLGMKKRGFGVGRWNGFGGKVQEGESIEESIKREIQEEVGLEVEDLNKSGIIEFQLQSTNETLEVHIFKVKNFKGEITESEEMKPQWFHIDEIPFQEMWPTDAYWFAMLLKGKKFKGRFLLDRPSNQEQTSNILEQELIEVEEI